MENNSVSSLDWMMWQIARKQLSDPPLQNLVRAIQHYTEKYGHVPNSCEVAIDWGPELIVPEGMQLIRSKTTPSGTILLAQDPATKTKLPGSNSIK